MIHILAQAQDGQTGGGGLGSLVVILGLILMFWLLMIRPQRQRMKQHQAMMGELGIGDEIETVAGVYGTIQRIEDDLLWVEIAPGTTIKMSRAAIRRRIIEEPPTPGDMGSEE